MAEDFDIQKDVLHDLDRRALEQILTDVANFKGFDIDLDLSGKLVHFTGHVMGDGHYADDRLSVLVYDESTPGKVIGVIRMNLYQWVELQMTTDSLRNAHSKATAEKK